MLLVFSYLVIPAVCATFLANSWPARFAFGWTIATVCSIASLYITGRVVDLPIGAAIVCVLGAALVLVIAIAVLLGRNKVLPPNPP